MGCPMKPKVLLIVTTVLMLLHGLGMFLGASDAAQMGLPDLSADELNMATGAFEIAGMFNIFLASVLISIRNSGAAALRSASKGIAVGYVLLSAGVVYHMLTLIPAQQPPLPVAIVFGLIALWALYVAFGTTDGEPAAA